MHNIGVLSLNRTFASAVYGFTELFRAANLIAKRAGGTSLFHCTIVGLDEQPTDSFSGHAITPDTTLQHMPRPDIWIIPGFFEGIGDAQAIETILTSLADATTRIANDHRDGSLIAGCCIGSFLLAEAGLLDNKPVQVYWRTEHLFRQLYPHLERRPDVTVLDTGSVITAAGASAYGYLALHLIRRLGGEQLATETAKYVLLDIHRLAQPSYRNLFPWMDHGDERIRQSQLTMLERYADELTMVELADDCQLSTRQYLRRFKQATELTPLNQLQKIRLMEACKKLEYSTMPTQNIVWDVGYGDASSFRKLFKKELGLTMEQYRQRYSLPSTTKLPAASQHPLNRQ